MEDILGAVVYPQLYSLSLINFESDTLLPYLRDDTKLRCLLTNQITHVNIKMIDKKPTVRDENESNLFALILSRSKRLTDLTYSQWFCSGNSLISMYNLPSTSCVCSTLTKLNIDVNHFDDCLYFLDGRFDSLSTLIIYIETISSPLSNIDNTRQLPKLKCLSLITYCRTQFYDSLVVPLLCRMSNLEELTLYLSIQRIESTYIDGNHLYNEILIHMPQLKKFIFSINTLVINKNIRINLPSNNDIQRSFIEREYQQIASYTHKESIEQRSTCHIYSLPYQFDRFYNMNCHFQGGIFNKVRVVMLTDRKHPFEQEFFQIVSNCFPFLQKLTIWNYQPQKRKQQLCPIITFPYLHCLILRSVNVDYADQFLNDTKIHLPCLLELRITYESLVMITYNFTNDATRLTCARLRILIIYGSYVRPENFHKYFPLCNM
ncbi:unnamed protein product [Rotaria sordida]|uniref:Uncharacterized protein n=1 Tax=Rotaria sordida TaxID=392033 RepID=A0A814LU95_9BILA|nr:unnamed protein product [Rotaria sordida]